jgi:hypothetical protein
MSSPLGHNSGTEMSRLLGSSLGLIFITYLLTRLYGGLNAHLFRRNFFLKFELLHNSFCAFKVCAASFDVFLDAKKSCGRTSLAATFFTSKVPQLFFSRQFFYCIYSKIQSPHNSHSSRQLTTTGNEVGVDCPR